MEESNWLNRTEMLIGKEAVEILKKSHVVVFGLGGVGSYVVEGLVRAGVSNISIIDKDIVDITNINRQIIADTKTVGKSKVDAQEERIKKINPNVNVIKIKEFVNKDNIEEIMEEIKNIREKSNNTRNINKKVDYVIDAIDTVTSKLEIIKYCYENKLKIISCMGTGNKLDASKFEIANISNTSVCPLAKIIRKELKKLNIYNLKVLYSKENPLKTNTASPASISFVPSVAGLLIAGEVVKDLVQNKSSPYCSKNKIVTTTKS